MEIDNEIGTIVDAESAKFGISSSQVLIGLLYVLRKHHVDTVGTNRVGDFRDGLSDVTGRVASSLADSVRDLAYAVANELEMFMKTRPKGDQSHHDLETQERRV